MKVALLTMTSGRQIAALKVAGRPVETLDNVGQLRQALGTGLRQIEPLHPETMDAMEAILVNAAAVELAELAEVSRVIPAAAGMPAGAPDGAVVLP